MRYTQSFPITDWNPPYLLASSVLFFGWINPPFLIQFWSSDLSVLAPSRPNGAYFFPRSAFIPTLRTIFNPLPFSLPTSVVGAFYLHAGIPYPKALMFSSLSRICPLPVLVFCVCPLFFFSFFLEDVTHSKIFFRPHGCCTSLFAFAAFFDTCSSSQPRQLLENELIRSVNLPLSPCPLPFALFKFTAALLFF